MKTLEDCGDTGKQVSKVGESRLLPMSGCNLGFNSGTKWALK